MRYRHACKAIRAVQDMTYQSEIVPVLMAHISYKTVWRLAGPNIISNILLVSISFAHLWIVAPFGPAASAAVVAGGRVHFLFMSASMALSVATTALVARAWGADDAADASASTTSSLSLAVLISLILGGTAFLFAPQIAAMFRLDAHTADLMVAYIRPNSLLNVVFALTITIAAAFRAIGDVVRPLQFTAFSSILGILGSYLLVHGSFGLPEMGVRGVPWGTAFGQAVVLGWFFLRWFAGRYVLKPDRPAVTDKSRIRRLVKIGAPAALEQLLIQMSFILFMVLIAGYGTAAFAAYGIGITVLSVCIVVGLGFGLASSALAGQRLGAEDYEGATSSGWAAMRLALIGMTILAVLTYALRTPLAAVLSDDMDVRQHTEEFILVLAIVQPLMAVEFAIGGALRGGGDTRYPLFVTFSGMIVGRLSVGYAISLLNGPVWAMYSVIIGDYTIKAILLILRFRKGAWMIEGKGQTPLPMQTVAGISRDSVRRFSFRGSHKEHEERLPED